MADNFVAEIRIFAFYFAPTGWAFCDGQILPISQNTALFSLLGTNYGGNGTSDFALPNLQGAVAINFSNNFPLGESGGETGVSLAQSQLPSHTHTVNADANAFNAVEVSPSAAIPANVAPNLLYSTSASPQAVGMNPAMVSVAGSSSPHNNLMPYLVLNYCIALQGIFPPRS
jgi:microcystin-dependent protein